MAKFTHYLITRFNVPIEQWDKDKKGVNTLDEPWLEHRFSLFTRFCIPTVAAQSETNFKWIIYCDSNSGIHFREKMKNVIQKVPETSLRFATNLNQLIIDLKHQLQNSSTEYVITSRVDNDDGLSKNYIETVQSHFKERDKLLLNLEGGVFYDVNKKVITRRRKSLKNHYTSLIEKAIDNTSLLTVLGYPHDNPPEEVYIENISSKNSWLKIIHERNVKSGLIGKPVLILNSERFYGLSKKNFPISYWNTWKYIVKRVTEKLGK